MADSKKMTIFAVMKKIGMMAGAVVALVMMMTMQGCEKSILAEEGTAEATGNLRVDVYEIEKMPFASMTRGEVAASEVCKRLNFAIYDMGGSRLKQVNQEKGKAGFGTVSFQLEEGDYQLVVVGHSSNGNPTMTNPAKIQFTNATGYTDTFLYNSKVSVDGESANLGISLNRIAALCRFVITDDIPAGVNKMQFYYTGGSGAFNAATGLGSVASKQTVTFDVTSDGEKQFDLYTFLHETSDQIALKVTALDANGNELYVREFDVPMEQNHITWLSGNFFNGSGSTSTTVTDIKVNTEWDGETHLTF